MFAHCIDLASAQADLNLMIQVLHLSKGNVHSRSALIGRKENLVRMQDADRH